MLRRRFHITSRIQWSSETNAEEATRLQQVVTDAVRRAVETIAGETPEIVVSGFAASESIGEAFSPSRYHTDRGTYITPSFEQGGPPERELPVEEVVAPEQATVDIPEGELPIEGSPIERRTAQQQESISEQEIGRTESGATTEGRLPALTTSDLVQSIRSHFETTQGRPSHGVYYGIYATLSDPGYPQLYYIHTSAEQREVITALMIYATQGNQRVAMRLEPGDYTLVVRSYGSGQLYQGSRLILRDMANPDNLDLMANFFVPERSDAYEVTVRGYRYVFYPRLQVLRVSQEAQMSVGSQSVYLADVTIWRVDESGEWTPIYPLALIYASIRYRWEIWRITTPGGSEAQERRELVRSVEVGNAFLRHVWEGPGTYEIKCEARLNYEDASPRPVSDQRRESIVPLEVKMAFILAQLETQERQPGAQRIWTRSATELLNHYRQLLQEEQQAAEPNQARIRALEEAIADMERHLVGRTTAGPFPIRAIFTERRTSQTRPLTIFVGPAQDADPDAGHTWYLIDLTYPAFYATYTGTGTTPREAIIAAFEDSRTSFRSKYPPGHILARLEWPGMEQYGIHPQDFMIETESWQRTAYEWLALGATIIGVAGLAVAIIFPPSAIVTGVLVIGSVAGATVSTVNIIERIQTNSFEWDTEAFTDITNIAASFAFIGAAATRGVSGSITRSIASGRPFTLSTVTRLRQIVGFERAMLYLGIGADLSSGIILAWDTYIQLRDLDAAFSEETLAEYERIYGSEEGRERWRNERYIRILGMLARAAVNGLLIAVSVRGSQQAAIQRRAFLRQPRIPGAERPVSRRLGVQPGRPVGSFPETQFRRDPVAFGQRERQVVAQRLGLDAAAQQVHRLSPQAAWQINASLDNLSTQQRQLLRGTLQGPEDLRRIRNFLRDGNNLEELANFLQIQPGFVRRGINTFETAVTRFREFRNLSTTVPDLQHFRWEQSNLEEHFRRHVLGEAGYLDESWRWAQRLGIAEEYGLNRTDYMRILNSTAPGDVALRQRISDNFTNAYGEYVHTVMARTNAFYRSGRGGDLVGSDGEMIWFASNNGTISSGYFPESPTARPAGDADDLEGILINAVREEQAVLQIFAAHD